MDFVFLTVRGQDALVVSLAPDRTDKGHLVFFKGSSLTPSSQEAPVRVSFTNTTNVKELLYDSADDTLFMTDSLAKLYITQNFSHNLMLPHTFTENMIATFSSPSSKIAIDWISKNIYHIDPSFQWIIVQPINCDAQSGIKTLINGLIAPKSISVDPLNGWVVKNNRVICDYG